MFFLFFPFPSLFFSLSHLCTHILDRCDDTHAQKREPATINTNLKHTSFPFSNILSDSVQRALAPSIRSYRHQQSPCVQVYQIFPTWSFKLPVRIQDKSARAILCWVWMFYMKRDLCAAFEQAGSWIIIVRWYEWVFFDFVNSSSRKPSNITFFYENNINPRGIFIQLRSLFTRDIDVV